MPATASTTWPASTLFSVVYTSVAVAPFTEADLATLLAISRRNNTDRGLTGLLLHRDGRFMQVLEGPERALLRALTTISADDRHRDLRVLDEERLGQRRFDGWAMQYRPMTDADEDAWFGSEPATRSTAASRAGALLDRFRTDAPRSAAR